MHRLDESCWLCQGTGLKMEDVGLEGLDLMWDEAKKAER